MISGTMDRFRNINFIKGLGLERIDEEPEDEWYQLNDDDENDIDIEIEIEDYDDELSQLQKQTPIPHAPKVRRLEITLPKNLPINICLILSFVILILNIFCLFSCTSDRNLGCQPQFTFEITDKTQKAKDTLSGLREGLKTISYVAKDLSIASYTNVTSYDYLNIDTLSDVNLFKHNYNGFCRFNKETLLETCLNSNGMDVFSSLVSDIGYQLGQISNSENSFNIGSSLAETYSNALNLLDIIYYKALNNEEGYWDLDMDTLTMIHNVRQMETFSIALSIFSIIIMICSSFMCLNFLLINLHLLFTIFKKSDMQLLITCAIYSNIIHIIFHSVLLLIRITLYVRLKNNLEQLEFAILRTGSGTYLLFSITFISALLSIILYFCDRNVN
ncbi:hypothetical protein DFJ63DRAFT_35676 [Scheffersomyces coipomensis]|uniref:uncharacterized protein n=1 Tax=Scheffersomyces coipomensis TaxID=1788519 RepID=UPI00315D7F9A